MKTQLVRDLGSGLRFAFFTEKKWAAAGSVKLELPMRWFADEEGTREAIAQELEVQLVEARAEIWAHGWKVMGPSRARNACPYRRVKRSGPGPAPFTHSRAPDDSRCRRVRSNRKLACSEAPVRVLPLSAAGLAPLCRIYAFRRVIEALVRVLLRSPVPASTFYIYGHFSTANATAQTAIHLATYGVARHVISPRRETARRSGAAPSFSVVDGIAGPPSQPASATTPSATPADPPPQVPEITCASSGSSLARYAVVPSPRYIEPNATYAICRRIEGRRFLLRPDSKLTALFVYLLALCAAKFGVTVHMATVMSTHFHLVVTVPNGNVSEFMHALVLARAQSEVRGRPRRGSPPSSS